jgi:hypothetical protein
MLSAPRLFGWKSPIQSAGVSRKANAFQDGGHIQRQRNIDHYNASPVASICKFPVPHYFSLVNTFNCFMCRYNIYKRFLNSILLPVAFEILYRHHCLINYIDSKAKCRHLKKIDLWRDFAACVYLSELEGQQLTKLGRKYQHDWMYLQSINSDKHLP